MPEPAADQTLGPISTGYTGHALIRIFELATQHWYVQHDGPDITADRKQASRGISATQGASLDYSLMHEGMGQWLFFRAMAAFRLGHDVQIENGC